MFLGLQWCSLCSFRWPGALFARSTGASLPLAVLVLAVLLVLVLVRHHTRALRHRHGPPPAMGNPPNKQASEA